jgi:methionine synthase II (cobalamin-independent)
MSNTEFNCLPTVVGSMPHTTADAALALILKYCPELPAWPQVPRRTHLEQMDLQYSEGFPGAEIINGSVRVDTNKDHTEALAALYQAYIDGDTETYTLTRERAAGFHALLEADLRGAQAVKGQITGPITFGLSVTDQDRKAIIYDDIFGDAVPRFLRLQAAWQEQQIKRLNPNSIMFLDEPSMTTFGSIGLMLSREQVTAMLDEVFAGISGIKGCHCCGNTDWSLILGTTADVISFDAFEYGDTLALYPDAVRAFFKRGGAVAWGIVPVFAETLAGETVASLKDRLDAAMAPFPRAGITYPELLKHALVTPCCGLATLPDADAAEQALALLRELSLTLRRKAT